MVEYVTLIQIINTMFNSGFTQEEMNEELGVEFTEYRNKVFAETYETINDSRVNVIMDTGLNYFQNKV